MRKITLKKILVPLFLSGLVITGFQNCGDFKVGKVELSSNSVLNNTSSYLVPASAIYGFTSNLSAKQIIPVKQYNMGDSVVDDAFVSSLSKPAAAAKILAAGGSRATAPSVVTWPSGEIRFVFDPNSGFSATELDTLRANLLNACGRWGQLANIHCTEVSSASLNLAANSVLPYLVVTQANVPLPWVSNPAGFCSRGSSCATIGYAGNNGVSHYAIDKSLINNMWNLTHEFGHVLGLSHEQQRPGRDDYVSVRIDKIADGNFVVAASLPAVSYDYDYASVMHYPIAGSRNADFLAGAGTTYLAYKTGLQFQNFTHMHRSALNFAAGSPGAIVNLPGYPSIQDAGNVSALYGANTTPKLACTLSGGKSVPHGARIGVFIGQTAASATNSFCDVEPRLCNNGQLTGGDGLEHFSSCPIRCNIAGQIHDYADRVTYYTLATAASQAACDASRKETYCDISNLGTTVAGFAACTVAGPPSVVTCPMPLQKAVSSAANNLGAMNSCVFNLTLTNAGATSSVSSSVAGSSYSLLCQSTGQWAANPTSSVCPAPANGVVTCPLPLQKTVVSAPNNVGATNSCVFNLTSTSGGATSSVSSSVAGSSYSLLCQSTGQWATSPTASVCPAPPNGVLTCPLPLQKTVTSAANSAGATNSCVFNLTSTNAGATSTVTSSIAGSSYALPCQTNGQWSVVPASSVCPAPAVVTATCPLPLQKTVVSAANNVGTKNSCVFNLTSTNAGATSNVTSSIAGSSYALACQSNSQWAASPASSVCPAPADVIVSDECPLLGNQSQMTAGSCSTGTVKAGSFQFDTNLNKFTWTCSVCNDGVLQSSAFIQQLMCVNQQLSTCTVSAISCLPGQTRTGNGTTIPFACISTPPPGSGCTNQSVPLLCNVNGIVKTVNASLNLTGAIGSSTPVMNSQASLAGLAFANPAVDFSKSSAFNLQWTCNGSSQWQFSSANGNCVFSSVYNSAAGATCDRHGETPLECTCTDSINATKVFPFVGEISHEECTYGESGSCTQVVTTPGTCDGKIPNYIPVYEPPGGGP